MQSIQGNQQSLPDLNAPHHSSASFDETVLVTGASGYLAGWMICGLLRQGYRVRGTLRNQSTADSVRAAVSRQVDPGDRLTFHTADLLNDDGWPRAFEGCQLAVHMASPMGQGAPRGTDLVTPARDGTLRVLKYAARAGVRRVVSTSSGIAALRSGAAKAPSDETVWTDLSTRGTNEYTRSKTVAERAAWEFMRGGTEEMTLTTVLPGLILGPVLTGKVSGSIEVVARLLAGRVPALPRIGFNVVDVRDLVDLHLRALRSPEAAGERFVATGSFLWMSDIARVLREGLGTRAEKVPQRALPDFVLRLAALFQEEARFIAPSIGRRTDFDLSKSARLLQWHPRDAAEAVLACAKSLLDNKLI